MSMRLKLPESLSFTVPPRKVVQLPDALFFCRTIPVGEVAGAAEVAAQVELALEAQSPFPVAQLYHGFHWRPGAKNACAFASYRKRFMPEQVADWADAEAVLPAFSTLLGARVDKPTTVLLKADHSCTAIVWDAPGDVPSRVLTRTTPPDLDADPAALRAEVLREVGEDRKLVELEAAPVLDNSTNREVFSYASGPVSATYAREDLDLLDMRDKEELASRRRARKRDMVLWRVFAGCGIALMVFAGLELLLIGGRFWQKARLTEIDAKAPYVAKIMMQRNLASRIEELSTRRMRPFEMLSVLSEKKPQSVVFLSGTMVGYYTIDVEAKTSTLNDVSAYRSAIAALDICEKVDLQQHSSRDGTSTFNLIVTFKPGAFQAPVAAPAPAAAPAVQATAVAPAPASAVAPTPAPAAKP